MQPVDYLDTKTSRSILNKLKTHKNTESLQEFCSNSISSFIYMIKNKDIATGLPNMQQFLNLFNHSLIRAKKNNDNLVLLFIDLDNFRQINTVFGYIKGDKFLQLISIDIEKNLGPHDVLTRIGGDKFVLLRCNAMKQEEAANYIERIHTCLSTTIFFEETKIKLSASIGVAMFPNDGETVGNLLNNAEFAMNQVKSKGKNGYAFYEKLPPPVPNKNICFNQEINAAIEKDEFELYYQPQVNVKTGKIIGSEALLRWNHPQKGLLNAGEFINYAEECGLLIPITEWVINKTLKTIHHLNSLGYLSHKVSINVPSIYLERHDFSEELLEKLNYYKISPDQIQIELLENASIFNSCNIVRQLNMLKKAGIQLAIDDFGTGYSALSYLQHFPINTIKIDRSFIKEIGENSTDFTILSGIISIAQCLNLNIVAEGVENVLQSKYLEKHGCFLMQGYLFSKPLPVDQFVQLLASNRD